MGRGRRRVGEIVGESSRWLNSAALKRATATTSALARRIASRRVTLHWPAVGSTRVGLQVKRVNAAALYLRPGLVESADYITAHGNPSILGERHLSPARGSVLPSLPRRPSRSLPSLTSAPCSVAREKLQLSLKTDSRSELSLYVH